MLRRSKNGTDNVTWAYHQRAEGLHANRHSTDSRIMRGFIAAIFVIVLNVLAEVAKMSKRARLVVPGRHPSRDFSIETSKTNTDNRTDVSAFLDHTTNRQQVPSVECLPWDDVTIDEWWQNHPDYEIHHETLSHTCYSRIRDEEKAEFFRELHNLQFHGDCSQLRSRFIVGSGFAATFQSLVDGFWVSYQLGQPFEPSKHREDFRWMYAPPFRRNETLSWAACETQDMFCYLLPLSHCNYTVGQTDSIAEKVHFKLLKEARRKQKARARYDWILSYLMRPLRKVRKRVVELLHTRIPNYSTLEMAPCSAIHVRRTDAMTEAQHPRSFYPLSMYIEKGNLTKGGTILLLTDDQSAIEEARILHPDYKWIYLDRIRHRGNAGINEHFPSSDEALEVLIILAELTLVGQCRKLVHGKSNMVSLFLHAMRQQGELSIESIQIDKDADSTLTDANGFMEALDAKLKERKRTVENQ